MHHQLPKVLLAVLKVLPLRRSFVIWRVGTWYRNGMGSKTYHTHDDFVNQP